MKTNLNIIKNIKIYLSISIVLVSLSIVIFFTKGLNYGIDFSGGNLFQLKYNDVAMTLPQINENLDELSGELPQVNSNSRKVQISDDGTVIIRVPELTKAEQDKVMENLQKLGTYTLDKEEKVGASVGDDLKKAAIYSLVIGSILIVLYITLRFEFSFAIGGILSLLHDIIIAVGFIALMGYEVDTPFIAAILTILGYSINDTIVIYDRIRENLRRKAKTGGSLEDVMNDSVNEVMVRSLNTSITTLFSVVAILVFGGASLKTFIMTLLIGILAGTYSSIFVATPIVYLLNKRKGNNMNDMFKEEENKEDKRVEKILV
ncbi:protein translocase subunit SecF [Fusobacterium massiliense]|jgi:protein-export membrane protein, secD/secF family|uniref:protein translocase subunit SecF n=1 Tax=Fusobacterium massiliense TaxID=1852365 RepID=UPI0028D86999|nr:protein translocase subunit SecF [Fusobacterium massiliense]